MRGVGRTCVPPMLIIFLSEIETHFVCTRTTKDKWRCTGQLRDRMVQLLTDRCEDSKAKYNNMFTEIHSAVERGDKAAMQLLKAKLAL